MNKEQLIKATQEINILFGADDPQINEEGNEGYLRIKITEAITLLNPDDVDKFSPDTLKLLKEMGWEIEAEKVDDDIQEAEEVDKETTEEIEDDVVDIPSLIKEIKKIDTMRDLKDIAKVYNEFIELRDYLAKFTTKEALRGVMLKTLDNLNKPDPAASVPTESNTLSINEKFASACPRLNKEEIENLEKLILKDKIVHNPILIWNDMIIDGHHRYAIAKKHNILFTTKKMVFDSENDAVIWIKENAIGQRNLPDFAKYELMKDVEEILRGEGRLKQAHGKTAPGKALEEEIKEKHDTRKKISEKTGISERQIAKAKVIEKKADEETKEKLRTGKTTIGKVYKEIHTPSPGVISDSEILLTGAKSLQKWVDQYSDVPVFSEFLSDISDIIEKIQQKSKLIN
jgi:ParB-like chromosome segregation protein Spo0J